MNVAVVATTRVPERIRLNPAALADVFVALPIPPRTEVEELVVQLGLRRAYEVLVVHPVTWERLVGPHIEYVASNMRRDGRTEDEIAVMKINAYANPSDAQVFGIPVVDDTPVLALARPIRAVAWECRSAWASGWRVALSLDERCNPRRVEGILSSVSPTDATVKVAGLMVPLDAVLAVHRPTRLGDSTWRGGEWSGRRYEPPQREELPL